MVNECVCHTPGYIWVKPSSGVHFVVCGQLTQPIGWDVTPPVTDKKSLVCLVEHTLQKPSEGFQSLQAARRALSVEL
jgi:hypothetical protein